MNLDDLSVLAEIDSQDMHARLAALPDDLLAGWQQGAVLPLPDWEAVQRVLVVGMGASAAVGELLVAYAAPLAQVPIVVLRDYTLPAWAAGTSTLVVAISHSGDTEETLAAFSQAQAAGCRCLAVSTGGELMRQSRAGNSVYWGYSHPGPARTATGLVFGLLLAALHRLAWLPDPLADLNAALNVLRDGRAALHPKTPAVQNLAKRLAGQLVGRWVVLLAAGDLAVVARRWQTQIHTMAKAWAQAEPLPDANHNLLAGVLQPEDQLSRLMVLFLQAPSDHPHNLLRLDLTRQGFLMEGLNTDFVLASGEGRLAHIWTLVQMGDFVAYYLALAYGVDPTPDEYIEQFKIEMRSAD